MIRSPATPAANPSTPNQATPDPAAVAVARLDAWLESMRCPGGYGGPVVHWWQQSLLYCGPGLDWRYEGIIAGYLTLCRRTGEARWLAKACRAGDDLLAGQQPDGHFAASCFEQNPASGGTPGEAACDVALLLLAKALREHATPGCPDWQPYAACAEHNLRAYYIDRLWDAEVHAFRDDPRTPSFVPNKAATACEALFLLAGVRQDDAWVNLYALPTLERVLAHQVRADGVLDGAIAQNTLGRRRIEKYFPIYIARCVPALVQGARWTGNERFTEAAWRAVKFLARHVGADGSLPTVLYPSGRANRYPSWIAPLADVLRAAKSVEDGCTPVAAFDATRERLRQGQDASGGIQTSTGFAAQAGGRPSSLPDVRDLGHVTGWCDKVLRYWAGQVTGEVPAVKSEVAFQADCVFRGKAMRYRETDEEIEITRTGSTVYRWRKGATWAATAEPEFWLR